MFITRLKSSVLHIKVDENHCKSCCQKYCSCRESSCKGCCCRCRNSLPYRHKDCWNSRTSLLSILLYYLPCHIHYIQYLLFLYNLMNLFLCLLVNYLHLSLLNIFLLHMFAKIMLLYPMHNYSLNHL